MRLGRMRCGGNAFALVNNERRALVDPKKRQGRIDRSVNGEYTAIL